MNLHLKPAEECRYDAVSLGEIMLRLDPGEGRIRTAREFKAWEGGGEYNVVRGLHKCFGLKMIKALAAPYVGLNFMPTGGISAANVRDYLAYDRIVACGGSWMVSGKLVKEGKFEEIEKLVREAADIVKEIRG